MEKIVFLCSHFSEKIQQIQKTIGFKRWLEQNTQIDESFSFCVLKEWVTKCYICEQKNIPIYFEKIPEDCITIFDILQSGVDVMWHELMKDDIKRNIGYGSWNDVCEYIKKHKKAFVKVYDKNKHSGWKHKVINLSNAKRQIKKILNEQCYNIPLYEDFQEFEGNDIEKLLFVVGYTREYADKYLFTTVHKVEHEHRFVLSGNKIISYSPQSLDFEEKRKPIDQKLVNSMVEFVGLLANKYWDKVPYKIWNIDIAFFDGMLDIVECHFNCQHLGHYLDNIKHFGKYFD